MRYVKEDGKAPIRALPINVCSRMLELVNVKKRCSAV